ncbi:N-acetyltransferase family protein [Shouchella sp. JSM 1781072]|uniref:GNAT family N-acetyltransferase n=1 Tax=Bacillaceae TaxID=186817 RepID=UPI000C06F693|nr:MULTISPECIES: GNAT family N-acetyltransferase [Bacillaceae]UTR08366.1 GNAT family N-acetyltransferase [Alkalihalobacillus sp. LMS6]
MKIRKAVLNDREDIASLAARSWGFAYETLIPQHVQQTFLEKAYSFAMLEQKLTNSALFLTAYSDKKQLLGFAQLTRNEKETELAAIYVDPDALGKGVGTSLFQEIVSNLYPEERLVVYVEEGNRRAEQFYITQGFRHVETFSETMFDHTFHTVKMSRERV